MHVQAAILNLLHPYLKCTVMFLDNQLSLLQISLKQVLVKCEQNKIAKLVPVHKCNTKIVCT